MKKALFILLATIGLYANDTSLDLLCGPKPQIRTAMNCVFLYLTDTKELNNKVEYLMVQERVNHNGFYGWKVTFNLKNEQPSREIFIRREQDKTYFKYTKAKQIQQAEIGNLLTRNTAGTTDVFIPDGVVSIEVTLQATGGNGASSYGTGGAGGQYIKAQVTVKPHNTYRLTLGAAGSNSTFSWVSFDGTSGFTTDSGFSTVTATCGAAGTAGIGNPAGYGGACSIFTGGSGTGVAAGGDGDGGGASVLGNGGAGGAATTPSAGAAGGTAVDFVAAAGGSGTGTGPADGGGGGGGSCFGAGGAGATFTVTGAHAGASGTGYGAGAGGGGYYTPTASNGGSGSGGLIRIRY